MSARKIEILARKARAVIPFVWGSTNRLILEAIVEIAVELHGAMDRIDAIEDRQRESSGKESG